MDTKDLIRMANQIGMFFKAYSPEEAKKEISTHLNNYWEPTMRSALLDYVGAGGKDLDAVVIAALPLVRRPLS